MLYIRGLRVRACVRGGWGDRVRKWGQRSGASGVCVCVCEGGGEACG